MIRKGTMEDYDRCYVLAKMFDNASEFINVKYEPFKQTWQTIVENGVIFLLEDNGEIIGGLGGIAYNDILNNRLKASELFWFVNPANRGGGLRLLEEFEMWAKDLGCDCVEVAFIRDSMPEKMRGIYSKRGYREAEVYLLKEF